MEGGRPCQALENLQNVGDNKMHLNVVTLMTDTEFLPSGKTLP